MDADDGHGDGNDSATTGARAVARLESLHSMIYFAPEPGQELAELGIEHPGAQYFAQRAAAMGAVGAGVVTATFNGFSPAMVARSIPRVWSQASPGDVVNARYRAADAALRRLLGDEVGSGAVQEAGTLARRALEGASPEDRPLFAAHADVPWPEEPHLMLWHAATLLREHRGDAHLHALCSAGLSGIESVITHTATGRGFLPAVAQTLRGWSEDQWAQASAGLADRGLLESEGGLTDAGASLRGRIEDHTTRMSAAPWRHLGAADTARLVEVIEPITATLLAAGAFPDGVFAPGSDRSHRPVAGSST